MNNLIDEEISKIKTGLSGVYTISSPSGKIYVGSSIDIKKRLIKYKNLNCKSQQRLHRSLLKYGADAHTFKVLVECEPWAIYALEYHFGKNEYDALGSMGLNCKLPKIGQTKTVTADSTRLKMSALRKGKMFNEEHKSKISAALKGKTKSKIHIMNNSASQKGKIFSEEHKLKLKEAHKRRSPQLREEMKRKNSELHKGRKRSMETRQKMSEVNKRLVLNVLTGVYYIGVKEAAESANLKKSSLTSMLNGTCKNKTSLIYA